MTLKTTFVAEVQKEGVVIYQYTFSLDITNEQVSIKYAEVIERCGGDYLALYKMVGEERVLCVDVHKRAGLVNGYVDPNHAAVELVQ